VYVVCTQSTLQIERKIKDIFITTDQISYEFVVFVVAAAAIKEASLHATAKGAQGVALELAIGCAVDDRVFEVVVRDAEMLQV